MKKLSYLLLLSALAFSACQKQPQLHSIPLQPSTTSVQTITVTLQPSDYALLTSGYPKSTLSFDDAADAGTYLPQILAAKYPTAADKSTATVTYTQSALYFKPDADSLYSDVYYQLTNSDYLLLPGNKYTDFSVSQVLAWLPYKYPSPANNQLALINFTPYPSTLTPPPPYSFLYFGGKWQTVYTIQPAQYTQAGVGKYDQFTTSNTESGLVSTFNFFLKNDITIIDTVKKNDIVFVSFDYYANSTAYQRVKPLEYDGSNFVAPYTQPATISLTKTGGVWAAAAILPIVSHTLTSADITLIAGSGSATGASASLLSNLGQYGDFETAWTTAELNAAFILVLKADYTTPATNTNYQVIFPLYSGGSDVNTTYTFQWDGTTWQPQQH